MTRLQTNIIPFAKEKDRPLTILTVEDNRLERYFLEEQIRSLGHEFMEAENGEQALDILTDQHNAIDVVVMDRIMPVLDGLSAVKRMKEDERLKNIPVVMVTGAAGPKDMQEGLSAGVFYYLAKPVEETVLRSVLLAATKDAKQTRQLNDELKRHRTSFNLIEACKFQFSTLEEAECLAAFMAHCFPEPNRVLQGLAELLINAVEHGILNIGYDRKSELLELGTWHAEIQRRQNDPAYAGKAIEAAITRKDNGVYVVVTDPGPGFHWKKYMNIDPSRAGDNHGRGIAQANAISFDKLTYNEAGNQAVAFVNNAVSLKW